VQQIRTIADRFTTIQQSPGKSHCRNHTGSAAAYSRCWSVTGIAPPRKQIPTGGARAGGDQYTSVVLIHPTAEAASRDIPVNGAACRMASWRCSLRRMTGVACMSVLKALGEMNRLRIMRLLLKEQLGVNAIAHRLQISEYNASKHLRILKEAGLLDMEKAGKQRLYSVSPSLKHELAANRNVLELDCCTFRFDKLPK
jgi:DNA-binding transcriptional ArsR family regulator